MPGAVSRLLLIGAAGQTGRRVAARLVRDPRVQLVLGGRDPAALEALAAALVAGSPDGPGTPHAPEHRVLDVSDDWAVGAACREASLVVVAASVVRHLPTIVRAASGAGADVIECSLSVAAKHEALRPVGRALAAVGRTVILDAGSHPGLPAVLVRWAAPRMEAPWRAEVAGAFALPWRTLDLREETVREFVAEIGAWRPRVWRDGAWLDEWRDTATVEFGPPAGRRRVSPMWLEELAELPAALPGLERLAFRVAGFGAAADAAVMAAHAALRFSPRAAPLIGQALLGTLRSTAEQGSWGVVQLEATGPARRLHARIAHDDAYDLTACAIAATVDQWLEGRRAPGLALQGTFVEPAPFLRALEAGGCRVALGELPP